MQSKDYQKLKSFNGNLTKILNYLKENNLFGLNLTLQEIGDVLGITRERVRQIESSAFKKLKHPKIGKQLRDYEAM